METKKVEKSLSNLKNAYNSLRHYRIEGSSLIPIEDYLDSSNPLDYNVSSANDALQRFDEVHSELLQLNEWADRTRRRLEERDPVTNVPRYGPKTATRLQQLLRFHDNLLNAFKIATSNEDKDQVTACYYSVLKCLAQKENETNMATDLDENSKLHLEKSQLELNHDQQIYEEEKIAIRVAKQIEEENISRLAEQSRLNRLEAKRKLEDDERRHELQLEASVTQGIVGATIQLDKLKESCERNDFIAAVNALHTLFNQILKNPENIMHRRIRLENKKFQRDIGRHEAGCCFLIAAGYKFEVIDGEKCLFLPEPDLEKDVVWSQWFDSLKEISQLLSTKLKMRS